ncbi:MAG: NADPH-dependent 2,4-dienoyl-CoA reductase [Betaproteobacteria bacterium]|nr:NADPH-dependent 2,4-dienoyl-CoA reductase [Betaproteobacteria bacterium]
MPPYPHLFAPLALRSLALKNRIVMGSMHTRLECEPDGAERLAAFYAERARGGAALIVTGGVSPDRAGLLEPDADALDDAARIPFHRTITDAVHAAGGRICLQILHAGRYAKIDGLVGASDIPAPINRRKPRALSDPEVEATVEAFARCAALAQEAGYDGVEIMGSEGYLITQFTCPRTNKRSDRWGGSLENRIRFPVEIVRRTRARTGPDFLIIYRLSALDLVEDGMTAQETVAQARAIEAVGADIFDTGIGWHEARVPTIGYMVPRAAWAFAVKRIREAVSIPVMVTNRINTPDAAERLLVDGIADLVSLARPMLADSAFANKARAGRADEINTCVACNQACLDYLFRDKVGTCLVNPRACYETKLPTGPAAHSKRIAVVGAGAAGLACAVTAAERGHAVSLHEAHSAIGGQLNLAAAVPGKEFAETLRYFNVHIAKSGIDLRLASRPSAQELAAGRFDHVVIATGVTPRIPSLPGIDHPKVIRYDEVLSGRKTAGKRVAIIGAGGIGFDVAEFLSVPADGRSVEQFLDAWGVDRTGTSAGGLVPSRPEHVEREIVVLQRKPTTPGRTLGMTTGWAIKAQLARRGVTFLAGVAYECVDDRGLHIILDGAPRVLEVDNVVLCAGQKPVRTLYDELAALGVRVHLIGGAERAEELDALRAIDQGTRLALGF